MKKYIRTADGIYEITNEDLTKYYVKNNHYCIDELTHVVISGAYKKTDKDIKVADTIEELCDEFCYIKNGIVSQYLTIDFKFKRDDEFCSLKNKLTANGIAEISKGISKYELQVGELKGAIWTDKGLIYVAKLNEKGCLELI